jgi:hypothetical protein
MIVRRVRVCIPLPKAPGAVSEAAGGGISVKLFEGQKNNYL